MKWHDRTAQGFSPAGLFSTRHILSALFGSIRDQQLRRVSAQADELELRTSILRGEFLSRVDLENVFGDAARTITEIIRSSELSRLGQDDILRAISSIPVSVAGIAERRVKSNGAPVPVRPKKRRAKKAPGNRTAAAGIQDMHE